MSCIYEVGPINYFNLSEPERNAVLASFASALQQLSSAVAFRVKLDTMSVVVCSDLCNVSYRRCFLESNQRLVRKRDPAQGGKGQPFPPSHFP